MQKLENFKQGGNAGLLKSVSSLQWGRDFLLYILKKKLSG
jgi:hypothetical protein